MIPSLHPRVWGVESVGILIVLFQEEGRGKRIEGSWLDVYGRM